MHTNAMKPTNIGIRGIELYFPNQCVDQRDLEKFDGVSEGKYTIGLGQTRMCFTDDREDIYSMALTAVSSLMLKYNIDPRSIGRLEVGTETLLDKSKSVKSVLMQLFEDKNTNIEGIDTVNACYGGTSALFNAINWMESSSWNGTNAIVVAGDIALYRKGNARPTGGAGCVAMLIGPDAPVVIEPGLRGSYMRHVYDFYKPDLKVEYPEVDGPLSLRCYTESVDNCYPAFLERQAELHSINSEDRSFEIDNGPESLPADQFDYMCFHAPTCKLVQKSYARLFYNDYLRDPENPMFRDIPTMCKDMNYEQSLTDKGLEKAFMAFSKQRLEQRVRPALYVPGECGNMYTASLYSALCGLLTLVGSDELQGKRIGMFSYGSGLASTLFSLRVVGSTDEIRTKLELERKLAERVVVPPEMYDQMCSLRETAHMQKSFTPSGEVQNLLEGTYYLNGIDQAFRRTYSVKEGEVPFDSGRATPDVKLEAPQDVSQDPYFKAKEADVKPTPSPSTLIVSDIEARFGNIRVIKFFRPGAKNAISRQLLSELAEQLERVRAEGSGGSTRALILASAVDNVFCAGADLKERAQMTEAETRSFLADLRHTFSRLEALPIPSIACVTGVALGGGLEMALCCHLRVFTSNTVVGLPETRLAIIPGAGGTYRLPSLVGVSKATDMILTGRQVAAVEALGMGLCNRLVGPEAGVNFSSKGAERKVALEAALQVAQEIACGGPVAIRAAIKALRNPGEETEELCYEKVLGTRDRNEALMAFRDKRKPVYIGS